MKFNSIKLGKVVTISPIPFSNQFLFHVGKGSKSSLSPWMLLFFPPPEKKNPYVASTKRIVYAFLSECQEEKNQKTKTKPFLNLLL